MPHSRAESSVGLLAAALGLHLSVFWGQTAPELCEIGGGEDYFVRLPSDHHHDGGEQFAQRDGATHVQ